MGISNAVSGQLELHNTWLVRSSRPCFGPPTPLTLVSKADEVKDYIKWAVDHSFGVIDVNIPELITTDMGEQPSAYLKPGNEEAQNQTEKLAGYLWENYIEPSDAEKLYFMGVGNAFHGIVKLLCDRGKQTKQELGSIAKQPFSCGRECIPACDRRHRLYRRQPGPPCPQ